MVVKDVTTQFAFAMLAENSNSNLSSIAFQDDSNDENLDACLSKTSKTLGQCILDCNNDSSCEIDCVSTFKDEHSECPCQVCGFNQHDYNIIHRRNAH